MSAAAWDEYLAWTRGAAAGQYEITEERAWSRLQQAVLRASVEPVELELPPDEGDEPGPDAPPSDQDPRARFRS